MTTASRVGDALRHPWARRTVHAYPYEYASETAAPLAGPPARTRKARATEEGKWKAGKTIYCPRYSMSAREPFAT